MEYIAEAVIEVYKNREKLRPMRLTWEAEYLRHFTCRCEYI